MENKSDGGNSSTSSLFVAKLNLLSIGGTNNSDDYQTCILIISAIHYKMHLEYKFSILAECKWL